MKTMLQRFVQIWFSDFDHQNLTTALSLVSLFTNGSFFFMENVNPIHLVIFFIFLLIICRCERLSEIKEKK